MAKGSLRRVVSSTVDGKTGGVEIGSGAMNRRRSSKKKKPGKLEAWQEVARRLDGEVQLDRKEKPRRVTFPHDRWAIVLDSYTVSTGSSTATYTRVRALYEARSEFRLKVTRRNPFHALAPLFGVRGVPMGYGRFDRQFFVRSGGPDLAKSLLRGSGVGQRLLAHPSVSLAVTRPGKRIRKLVGESVGEVQLQKGGVVKEVALLSEMVTLCRDVLDHLLRLGVATDAPVPAEL